ncbi:hypothetical protein DACRYDRAFT_113399 [Dacryopinax primogenitus]|uniref:NAD dependent epimerase/dehydratase n=1 Tax=Dacryopinax primogenitus (strain DJM 731) TaxID=1858805 RepID=M5GEA5_DACPD|nr:uncharacterized protein DACRYDRAFT_113399 [Dacryopinax primogenitus]EJU05222.1 hypothetical protein DACRYDRAFT_113399 [Dacryopinax primogenitus]
MKDALEILGFGPCHHMASLFADSNGRHIDTFLQARTGKRVHWRRQMAGFGSTVDHPTTDFALELIDTFPDALVILTVRDSADVWWKSVQDTIYWGPRWQTRMACWSLPPTWKMARLSRDIGNWYRRNYGSLGPECYTKHNARMVELIPREKLLVYNVKEGWEPLCAFLGVPVPTVPFPRKNDTAEMKRLLRVGTMLGVIFWIAELGLVGWVIHQVIKRRLWDLFNLRTALSL